MLNFYDSSRERTIQVDEHGRIILVADVDTLETILRALIAFRKAEGAKAEPQ